MGLTKAEKKALERLQAKAEEPDRPLPNLNVSIDLGDKEQVSLARKMGWFGDDDDDNDNDGNGDEPDEGDDTPRRPGFFKD